MTTLTATFDGLVFKPDETPDLTPNTRVRIVVEEQGDVAHKPQGKSFLRTAQSLHIDGSPDWSSRVDEHLYGEMLRDGD